jgi:hypothetical protein
MSKQLVSRPVVEFGGPPPRVGCRFIEHCTATFGKTNKEYESQCDVAYILLRVIQYTKRRLIFEAETIEFN